MHFFYSFDLNVLGLATSQAPSWVLWDTVIMLKSWFFMSEGKKIPQYW